MKPLYPGTLRVFNAEKRTLTLNEKSGSKNRIFSDFRQLFKLPLQVLLPDLRLPERYCAA